MRGWKDHSIRMAAVFASIGAGIAHAQEGVRPVETETVWEADAGLAPALTCPPSSAPVLQRQFDPVTGDLTGQPEPKMRYLAIRGRDFFQTQAVRVTWDGMPNWPTGHSDLVGQQKWMTEPFQVCENSGQGTAISPPDCSSAPGLPQKWFWAAELNCDPSLAWYGDLTSLRNYCSSSGAACLVDGDCAEGTCGVDGVIHLFDPGIAPSRVSQGSIAEAAENSVQVIDQACPINSEDAFSDPLATRTAGWGDVMGTGFTCPYPLPNNTAELVGDVIAQVFKFSNNPCAAKKTRCDVDQDFLINMPTDILGTLNAFSSGGGGFAYPAPAPCP